MKGKINSDILKYIIGNTPGSDRLKLMKLTFLIDHYDPIKRKLRKNGQLNLNFIIYSYGVFSFEVYNALLYLIKNNEVSENNQRVLSVKNVPKLDNQTRVIVDKILKEFEGLDGWELASKTLSMINISEMNKKEYIGHPVKSLITS